MKAQFAVLLCASGLVWGSPQVDQASETTPAENALAVIEASDDLILFRRFLKCVPKLEAELSDPKVELTVLAPTNEAWTAIGRKLYFELLEPENRKWLEIILRTHLLPKRYPSSELFRWRSVEAASGVQLFCYRESGIGLPRQPRASYLRLDEQAGNSLMHTVDRVFVTGRPSGLKAVKMPNREYMTLASAYLHEPLRLRVRGELLSAHQLRLAGRLGDNGVLALDTNVCSVNSFGDSEMCSRIAPILIPVRLKIFYETDPKGLERLHGSVSSPDLESILEYVVPPEFLETSPENKSQSEPPSTESTKAAVKHEGGGGGGGGVPFVNSNDRPRSAPRLLLRSVDGKAIVKIVTLEPAAVVKDMMFSTSDRVIVPQIVRIHREILGDSRQILKVTASGIVPSPGWTDPTLSRVVYKTPPPDGVQEYVLTAKKPAAGVLATQQLSIVEASDTWDGLSDWVLGLRVLGIGDGVKEIPLFE